MSELNFKDLINLEKQLYGALDNNKNKLSEGITGVVQNAATKFIKKKFSVSVTVSSYVYKTTVSKFIMHLYPKHNKTIEGNCVLDWTEESVIKSGKTVFNVTPMANDFKFKTTVPRTWCSINYVDNYFDDPNVKREFYKTVKITFTGKQAYILIKQVLDLIKKNHLQLILDNNSKYENNNIAFSCRDILGEDNYYFKTINGIEDKDIIVSEDNKTNMEDIRKFIGSKNIYNSFDIKYKFGILLYGEPGCGKSSMIKRIFNIIDEEICNTKNMSHLCTNDFGTSFHKSSLATVGYFIDVSNKDLAKHLRDVSKQIRVSRFNMNVVIFEEIDTIYSRRRDDSNISDEQLANIKALLQFLDSADSPENTIFIGTTNYIDKLDPALIRAGRFDLKIKMDMFNNENEARQLCDKFGTGYDLLPTLTYPLVPSELQYKLFKKVYDKNN